MADSAVEDTFIGAFESTDPDIIDPETALDADGALRLNRWTDPHGSRNGLFGGADLLSIEHNDNSLLSVTTAFDADGVLRIVSAQDSHGDDPTQPLPAIERAETLRMAPAKIRHILAGNAAQLVINTIGDSYTYNRLWYSGLMRKALADLIGDAGPGYIDFTNASNGSVLNSPNAYSSGYTLTPTGAWSQTVYTSPSPSNGEQSTTATAKMALAGPATPVLSAVSLHYIKTANGQARYRWNGGSWTTLDLATGAHSGLNQIAITGLPVSGTWALEIEWVSGTVTVCGIDMRSAVPGVRMNKLGKNGGRAQHLAALNATQWQQGQAALEPDLIIVMEGTNDQADRTAEEFAADFRTVIERARAACPYADILAVVPAENFVSPRLNSMRHLDKAVRYALRDLDVAFLSMQPAFGRDRTEYGVSGRAFFDEGADPYHPTLLGFAAIAAAILKAISP